MRDAPLSAVGLATLLFACGQSVPRPAYSAQPTNALVAIASEPPPARVENAPPRPPGVVVWIDGEWVWRRNRWAWMPGRWVTPPPGATYSPWVTVRTNDGTLFYAPATWRDAAGKAIEAPKPIAVATVESGAVVNPEGEMERTTVTTPR